MKQFFITFCTCLFFFGLAKGQTPSSDPHWELIWMDHFNLATLDGANWTAANNFDHYSASATNGEHQVYTSRLDNVYVDSGCLVIQMKQETYSCPPDAVNMDKCSRQFEMGIPYLYTSGWVETKQIRKTLYGFIEARIKVPYSVGLWPSFWLKSDGTDILNGSSYQEIDVFEILPGRYEDCTYATSGHFIHGKNQITSNLHNTLISNEPFCTSNFGVYSVNDYTQWHLYAIEWSPSKIVYYIDGQITHIIPNTGNFDPEKIIFNMALNPTMSNYYSSLNLPKKMYVDYIKVYKLKNDCNTILNACNYNFNSHDNRVKKKIILGNGSCYNTLGSTDNVYLRASEGIEINGIFTVPVGATLYLDSSTCY